MKKLKYRPLLMNNVVLGCWVFRYNIDIKLIFIDTNTIGTHICYSRFERIPK